METVKKPGIGQRLRRERERLGWTQEQLARKIDTSAASINRWENDKTFPRAYYREQLCRVFHKSLDELFGPDDDAENDDCKLPTLWNVPHLRNLYFTDRERVLHYLHDNLTLRENSTLSSTCAVTCAISGLGGVGKTQTAVEYAYRYGSEYKAVFWAKASSHKSLISDFVALAQPLKLLEQEEADQDRVVTAVKRWLQTNSRWLLILDNADDLEMVCDFLPALGDGRTLLTTRSLSAKKCWVQTIPRWRRALTISRSSTVYKGNTRDPSNFISAAWLFRSSAWDRCIPKSWTR